MPDSLAAGAAIFHFVLRVYLDIETRLIGKAALSYRHSGRQSQQTELSVQGTQGYQESHPCTPCANMT